MRGISMVYQERRLVGPLSVAENVFAGRQPTSRLGVIERAPMFEETRRIALADLEVDIDPGTAVASLSPGQRRESVEETAKGLSHELKLLILDEPTSSLEPTSEGRRLFRILRRLAAQGVSMRLRLAPAGRGLRDRRPRHGDAGRRVAGVRGTGVHDPRLSSSR